MITRKLIVYVVLTLSVIVTICSVKPHKTKGTFGEQKSSRGYDVEEAVENKESEVDEAVGNEESKVEEAVENNDRNRNEESKGGDFDKGFNKDIVNKDDLFAMSSRHLTTSSSSSSNPTLSPKTIHQIFKKHEPELYDSFNAKGMTITNQHVIAGSFHMEFENMTGDYPKTKSVLIGLDSRDEFGNVPMTIDWVKEFYFENSGNGYAIEVEDVYFDTKLNEFILVGSYRRGRISGLAGFILRVNVAGEVVKGNYFIKVETLTSVVPWHESNDGEHGYMVVGKEKLFKNSIVQRAVVMSVEFSLESSEPKCSAGVLGRGAFGEVHKYSTFHQVIQYTDESNSSGGLRKAFAMVGATQLHDLTESTAENFLPRECHQESEVILTIVNKDCGFAMSKSFGVSKPSESDSVNQRGFSLVQDSDSDGGLIITGSTARTSISTGRCEVEPDEMLTLKVDRLGLVKWSRSYQINYVSGEYYSSIGYSVQKSSVQGLVVAGRSFEPTTDFLMFINENTGEPTSVDVFTENNYPGGTGGSMDLNLEGDFAVIMSNHNMIEPSLIMHPTESIDPNSCVQELTSSSNILLETERTSAKRRLTIPMTDLIVDSRDTYKGTVETDELCGV